MCTQIDTFSDFSIPETVWPHTNPPTTVGTASVGAIVGAAVPVGGGGGDPHVMATR